MRRADKCLTSVCEIFELHFLIAPNIISIEHHSASEKKINAAHLHNYSQQSRQYTVHNMGLFDSF